MSELKDDKIYDRRDGDFRIIKSPPLISVLIGTRDRFQPLLRCGIQEEVGQDALFAGLGNGRKD